MCCFSFALLHAWGSWSSTRHAMSPPLFFFDLLETDCGVPLPHLSFAEAVYFRKEICRLQPRPQLLLIILSSPSALLRCQPPPHPPAWAPPPGPPSVLAVHVPTRLSISEQSCLFRSSTGTLGGVITFPCDYLPYWH